MTTDPNGTRRDAPGIHAEFTLRDNGIGWLELKSSRGSAIPLGLRSLDGIVRQLQEVAQLARHGDLRILVIATRRPISELTGYDLEEVRGLDAGEFREWSSAGQAALRAIEQLPVPTVAAIQSEWLGGAAELALACSYRVGCDASGSRIGLPQTRLGILPAWGGTVRLPRLVGLRTAMQMVVTGQSLPLADARGAGLIDRVLPTGDFALRVERYALRRLDRPGVRSRRSMRLRLLDDTAPGRRLLVARAGRRLLREASSRPAARAAITLLTDSITLPLEEAFRRETEVATRLALSADALGRLHSQRLVERAQLRLPLGTADLEAAAIIGTGPTSSDFAHLLASAGSHVRLRGTDRASIREGVGQARRRLDWEHDQGRISEREAHRRSARIEGVTGFGGFGTLNLLIGVTSDGDGEAGGVIRTAESHIRPDCVIALHDWTARIDEVQTAAEHPERVAGIAPALPLERFPFLEIVPGAATGIETVATLRRLARRLGLASIAVRGHAPTPGTRLVAAFLAEGLRLIAEGAPLERIDEVAVDFGFALGPFHRIDGIGSQRVHRMLTALTVDMGSDVRPGEQLARVAAAAETFYHYQGGRPARASRTHPPGEGEDPSHAIETRLVVRVLVEALRILEEGGVADAGELELISIHALGFPRERGGILYHAETIGANALLTQMEDVAARFGPRFAPPGILIDLARSGDGLFGGETLSAGQRRAGMLE